MLDDLNNVFLEGMIVFAPEIKENNGKRAMNFVVENERHTSKGRESFKYNCVAWDKVIERVGDRMLPGALIRITGHLQDSVLQVDTASVNSETKEVMVEKRPFHHTKVCADYIEFND
jgi:single-stranded DNA-binding protein